MLTFWPLFNVVPVCVVEVTAQVVTSKGSQIATSIDEKHFAGDIIFPGKSMQESHRGVSPAAAEHVHFVQELDSVSMVA
jgi:hypothetical protein